MGVYFDYFRAEDDDQARATHATAGGPLAESTTSAAFDGVSTKGVFPDPHLEELAARASGVPYARGPRTSTRLWPPADTPPPVDDTSMWFTDPGVERLENRLRDLLAGIDQQDAAGLGASWAADISYPPDQAAAVVAALAALAGRARDAGQALYCWSSL